MFAQVISQEGIFKNRMMGNHKNVDASTREELGGFDKLCGMWTVVGCWKWIHLALESDLD